MTFPFNQEGNTLSEQAILAGVAGVSAGSGVLRVSSITAGATLSFSGDAASNRVSAIQQDAGNLRISAIGVTVTTSPLSADSSAISAKQESAANLRVSSFSGDAGQFLVSARLTDKYLSAFIDNGSISAKSSDAGTLLVSAKQGDGGLLRVSAIQSSAANFQALVKQDSANDLRISAILAAGVSSVGAASFAVSAAQNDAGALHTSSYSGDASQVRVSATLNATTDTGLSMFSTSAGIAQTSAIKASKANLYGYNLGNRAGIDQYLNIYDASAVSAVTLGTTVPTAYIYTPATGGANMTFPLPATFTNGIVVAVVSAPGGTTAGASAMVVNLFYK